MPHARARVKQNGRVILDGEADTRGWLLTDLDHEIDDVVVEWAPSEMPDSPSFPFRSRYHVSLAEEERERARRRLSNVGFSNGHDLEDRVRRFQKRHAYTKITGDLDNIVEHVHAFRPPGHDRDPTHFEVAQMQGSRHLIGVLAGHFPVSRHNVLADSQTAIGGHELGRKIGCPGSGFDWERLEAAGLATVTRAFRPPSGHPMHPTYQIFETHFSGSGGPITSGSPLVVRTTLEAMLRGLGYHIPLNATFAATTVAVEAFQLRHFGGPSRSADLARVQTASHKPIIDRLTVDTLFGVFEDRAGFAY